MRCSALLTIPLAATLVLPGCPTNDDDEVPFTLAFESPTSRMYGKVSIFGQPSTEFLSPSGNTLTTGEPLGSASTSTSDGEQTDSDYFPEAEQVRLLDVRYDVGEPAGQLFLVDGALVESDDDSDALTSWIEEIALLRDAAFLGSDVIVLEGDESDCSLLRASTMQRVALPGASCAGSLQIDDETETVWIASGEGIVQIIDDVVSTLDIPADAIDFDPEFGILYAQSQSGGTFRALAKEDGEWSELWSLDEDLVQPRAFANIGDAVVLLSDFGAGSQVSVLAALDGDLLAELRTDTRMERVAGSDASWVFSLAQDDEVVHVLQLLGPSAEQ